MPAKTPPFIPISLWNFCCWSGWSQKFLKQYPRILISGGSSSLLNTSGIVFWVLRFLLLLIIMRRGNCPAKRFLLQQTWFPSFSSCQWPQIHGTCNSIPTMIFIGIPLDPYSILIRLILICSCFLASASVRSSSSTITIRKKSRPSWYPLP